MKWWGDLVLDDLDAGLVPKNLIAFLYRADTPDIETNRRVELQSVTAGRGLGISEHHANLHSDLVNEDHHRVRTLDVGGQFAKRLRHEPGLQANMGIAHFAFDLSFWRQCGDRVDNDDVYRR